MSFLDIQRVRNILTALEVTKNLGMRLELGETGGERWLEPSSVEMEESSVPKRLALSLGMVATDPLTWTSRQEED